MRIFLSKLNLLLQKAVDKGLARRNLPGTVLRDESLYTDKNQYYLQFLAISAYQVFYASNRTERKIIGKLSTNKDSRFRLLRKKCVRRFPRKMSWKLIGINVNFFQRKAVHRKPWWNIFNHPYTRTQYFAPLNIYVYNKRRSHTRHFLSKWWRNDWSYK